MTDDDHVDHLSFTRRACLGVVCVLVVDWQGYSHGVLYRPRYPAFRT